MLILLAEITFVSSQKRQRKAIKIPKNQAKKLTVAKAACSSALASLFSTLCDLIQAAGLEETLDSQDTKFTVFAPTNKAFEELPDAILNAVQNDVDLLRDVLLFHTFQGNRVKAKKLVDGAELQMVNGEITTTTRENKLTIYQSGPGNNDDDLPRIILPNVFVSNGMIHAVDEVLLPDLDL